MFKKTIILILLLQYVDNQSIDYESPCPQIFTYDTSSSDTGKWYGTITVTSDVTLYGIWIDIILDRTAEAIGSNLGDVSTFNNIEFKIENKNQVLSEGTLMSIRILVRYDVSSIRPRIKHIRFNGRQICSTATASSNRYKPRTTTERIVTNQYNQNGALPLDANASFNNKPIYEREQTSRFNNNNNEINGITSSAIDTSNGNRGQSFNRNTETSTRRSSTRNVIEDSDTYNGNRRQSFNRNAETTTRRSSSTRDTIENSDAFNANINTNLYSNQQSRGTQYNPPSNSRGSSSNDFVNRDDITGDTYVNNDNSRVNPYNPPHRQTTSTARPRRTSTSRNNNGYDSEDYDYADSPSKKKDNSNDYFEGDFRLPADSKIDPTPLPKTDEANHPCGKVAIQPAPLVVGGQTTAHGQWPWHVALYQSQTVDSKYICGGSLITTSHVITAAHCVTRKNSSRLVNAQTLTVYLGKYNLRRSSDAVQIMLVRKIFVHPEYNATNFFADVSVLKLNKPCDYTIYVRPVCLWKESESALTYVIEREGTVVGWGFDENGHVTEELTLVKMPIVKQSTCLWSFSEFYSHFTSEKSYCAGFENGTSVCNGDSGGGMVFPDNTQRESTSTWRLRGLVSLSVAKQNEYRCDPYHYVVFTDLAQFLDWIKEKLIQ